MGADLEPKRGKKKLQHLPNVTSASGWYRRLHGPIFKLLLYVSNSVQLWLQSFPVWHFLTKKCSLFRIITDYCRPQKRPTIWIWVQLLRTFGHFEPQRRFFVPKNCTILPAFIFAPPPSPPRAFYQISPTLWVFFANGSCKKHPFWTGTLPKYSLKFAPVTIPGDDAHKFWEQPTNSRSLKVK